MKKLLLSSLFSMLVGASIQGVPWAAAQRSGDDDLSSIKVCAAVYPCKDNGEVLEEFATGECAETYREMCEEILPAEVRSLKKLSQCRASSKTLLKENKRLRRELRHARRLARLVDRRS